MSDATSSGIEVVRRLLAWSDSTARDDTRSPAERLTQLAWVAEITVDVIGLAADKAETTPRLVAATTPAAPQLSPPPPPMPPAPSVLDGDDNWPMPTQPGWVAPPAPSIATDSFPDSNAA